MCALLSEHFSWGLFLRSARFSQVLGCPSNSTSWPMGISTTYRGLKMKEEYYALIHFHSYTRVFFEVWQYSSGSRNSKREVPLQHRCIARPYLIAGHSNFHSTPYNWLSGSYVHLLKVVVCMIVHSSAN